MGKGKQTTLVVSNLSSLNCLDSVTSESSTLIWKSSTVVAKGLDDLVSVAISSTRKFDNSWSPVPKDITIYN